MIPKDRTQEVLMAQELLCVSSFYHGWIWGTVALLQLVHQCQVYIYSNKDTPVAREAVFPSGYRTGLGLDSRLGYWPTC